MRPHITLRLSIGLGFALLVGLPSAAAAQDGFVVIAHAGNPVTVLKRDDVAKLFLRKRLRWANGQSTDPLDQVESSPVRRRFSNAILGMDVPSVKGYWQEIVFSGKGDPPLERASDADVIAYVKTHPNAIAYIASASPADGVKVITVSP